MCYPCRCPRRSISCNGGDPCYPRPCCRERSCSMGNCCRERSCSMGNRCRERSCSAANNRVIFPGEFQKFSDMIPPAFLLKQPEDLKAKKKPVKATKEDCDTNPCEPEGPCDSEFPCEPGVQCIPDPCAPWCCPPNNQMTINMCPQPQWICFTCPGATPIDPQCLPPAGVPTKRCPPFNPCTGQIYQCENVQMVPENPNQAAQCPTYNQNCPVSICYGPANPCPQFNPSNFGERANTNVPNQAYYQSYQGAPANPCYPYNGGDGTNQAPQQYSGEVPQRDKRSNSKRKENEKRSRNVSKATETRKDPNANQNQQYNQFGYVEGANPDQAYYQYCQGFNMYPYYQYNSGDGQSVGSPTRNPQGDKRSTTRRKGNETREGNIARSNESRRSRTADQRHQYNRDMYPQQNQYSRSNSQGNSHRSPNQNQYDYQNRREESMDRGRDSQAKQSGRVPQQNPAAGQGVSRSDYRSTSQRRENESRVDPRSNNRTEYNSQNLREEPRDSRKSPRASSPGNQPARCSYRSQSLEPQNESRRDNSARSPQPSRSGATRSDRDARSKSLGKHNVDSSSRENRCGDKPQSNLQFYQQNMGMSYGPSNLEYVADCPSPDPIYTTQLESTLGDSGSSRKRRESIIRESTCNESLPENQATRAAPPNRQNRNCCLRFNPNNQYMTYECCCPPSQENSRSPGEKNHHTKASNDRSQPINRSKNSGSLNGHQMSTKTSKSPPSSAASKKNVCKKCNRAKPSQPTLAEILAKEVSGTPGKRTLAEILANEASEQPHVLMLETNKEATGVPQQEPLPIKITPKKPASSQPQDSKDQCDCDSQDEASSSGSEDSCNTADTATDNGKEKPNGDAPKPAESANSCWIRCTPNPWLCCYGPCNVPCNVPCNGPCSGPCSGPCNNPCNGPCNGRFYCCGNCYNGCRTCCYYQYNPCGGYFCSQPPTEIPKPVQKAPAKPPKEKKGDGKGTTKRKKGGVSMSNSSFCTLQPSPAPGFSIGGRITMPGYYPTEHPQYISPYSGHWQAREVSNRMFSNQNR